MRQRSKKDFRPTVESIESRIAASAGLSGPAHALSIKAHKGPKVQHQAAHKPKDHTAGKAHAHLKAQHHATHKPKDHAVGKGHAHPKAQHHATHKPKGHAHPKAQHHATHKPKDHANKPVVPGPPPAPPVVRPVPIRPVAPPPLGNPEAWVEIVNTTGLNLRYQISLGPYQDGKFLSFDIAAIGPNSIQYRYASLIAHGQQVEPSFAIKFENGPVVPLNTGPSAASARGYYIFLDTNLQPSVAPFVNTNLT